VNLNFLLIQDLLVCFSQVTVSAVPPIATRPGEVGEVTEVAEAPEAAEAAAALRLGMKMWKTRFPWANNLQLVDFPDLCSLPQGTIAGMIPHQIIPMVLPDADIPKKERQGYETIKTWRVQLSNINQQGFCDNPILACQWGMGHLKSEWPSKALSTLLFSHKPISKPLAKLDVHSCT
jgi:hypothetical protein